MAGGGRRNAAGKAGRLSVMTEAVQWAFPAQPMPWRDAISRCSCNCQGGSGMGGWVVQCELGLTLEAGQAAGAKRRAPLASCRAPQSELHPGPGGLWPRPRSGSRLEFQTRGRMGQTQSRPPSTTWQGMPSPQQAPLYPVQSLPVPPPVRSPSLGCLRQALPGGFREASGKFPGKFMDT
jgi:hypothetical protein